MTGWLASILDVNEARLALAANADIIDAKNPREGALGGLPHNMVHSIVRTVNGQAPVSATIGDFPAMEPDMVFRAIQDMAETGVDYVKIGLFPSPALKDCLDLLAPLCKKHQLIAVMFADCNPDWSLMDLVGKLGFTGVMMDTFDKSAGSLLHHQPLSHLEKFVVRARALNLICGFAGSLKAADIPVIRPLEPDYLGFRGALCHNHVRSNALNLNVMNKISMEMQKKIEKNILREALI